MAAVTDLDDLAHEFLDACAAALALTDAGTPDRQLVSPGPPAWDCCPQLSVHVNAPAWANTQPTSPDLSPGHRIQAYGVVYLVEMVATMIRCSPTINEQEMALPRASDLTAAAKATNDDIWAVWNYIPKAIRAGTLFAPKERETFVDLPRAQNQEGGCAGWEFTVRVQLDGFSPGP